MHYLKCNHCGHLNEVKGEYLVFCSKCNKKLDNNFPDWKKRNPGKTLADFKKTVCVSEEEIQTIAAKTKKRPKGLKYWIGFAAMFAIFYAVGSFGGESIVRFFKSQKTSKEVLEQEWIKETYGNHGLALETPVILSRQELPIPEHVKQYIEEIHSHAYLSGKGFKVMINSIKYKPAVGQADLQGAANGAVNEMKMQQGVTDFNYNEEPINKNDIPGLIQKGTYNHDGIGVEFINATFREGLVLWQILVAHETTDEVGRIAAKRVIESIEIDHASVVL
jgi:hypothetical protein